jgi:cytochrome c556
MKRSLLIVGVALALGCGIAVQALAQTNPNQLIAQRKGAMSLQAKYFGSMLAMAQGRIPYDASTIQRNADYLAVLSQLPWDDFQASTAGAAEGRTRAKEDIYKDPAKFKARIDTLQADVKKLVSAAHAGDRDAVNATVRAVGRTCNSCHEAFATFEFRFKVE